MDPFLAFLSQHDDAAWLRAIDRLQPAMHPVDRTATRIWFHFYPLSLDRAMARDDAAELARKMELAGRWRLADQIDHAHAFLYGHQYWFVVKHAVLTYAADATVPGSLDLAAQIQEIARRVAAHVGVDASLIVGITAVALRTLQHVGPAALEDAPGQPHGAGAWEGRTADDVVRVREKQDSQGLFGFLRGERKLWSVVFDERYPAAQFPLINSQHLTTAASLDRRNYRGRDPRCAEGPIPVQCQSCSCGTCWIGVLGGADRLSPLEERERAKLAECGYITTDETHPPIRLACTAQGYGRITIVIPPWNGIVARVLKNPR